MTHKSNNTISIQTINNNYYLVIRNHNTKIITSLLIHKTQAEKWLKKLDLKLIDTTPKLI